MPDWFSTLPAWAPVAISALALIVSSCSLFISWRMSRRTIDAERVTAWIEVATTSNLEWLVATVNVKNPSHLDIKVQKLVIQLPHFRLGDLAEVIVEDRYGNRALPKEIGVKNYYTAMPFELAVGAGETKKGEFLIYQPAQSRRRKARVSVMYWTMEPKPKFRMLPITIKTRPNF